MIKMFDLLVLTSLLPGAPVGAHSTNHDVLFFAVDDLRPSLGPYGVSEVKTPHLDELANRSMVFERMYTAVSVCAPARTAIMVGRRPDTTHNWEINSNEYWREVLPEASSLPQYFVQHGFNTMGGGKLFHPGAVSGNDDTNHSWNSPYYHGRQSASTPVECHTHPDGYCRFTNTSDGDLVDGDVAIWAKTQLMQVHANRSSGADERPFFLGVGFHKPHMPEYCPSKYWDMYQPETLTLAANPSGPANAPQIAVQTSHLWRNWFNLSTTNGPCMTDYEAWQKPPCVVEEPVARTMRWAYYACISYTDANIGGVIAAITQLGFAERTVIVVWGDHGWHLGELNQWAKYTNFEQGTRIPFIVHVPGQTTPLRTAALSEATDIFPTVVDLAGLPVPPLCPPGSQQMYCVEGISLKPLWDNQAAAGWKPAAFSQFPRPNRGFPQPAAGLPPFSPANGTHRNEAVMGYSVRTDTWRYTEWVGFDPVAGKIAQPITYYGKELYSHVLNPVPLPNFDCDNDNVVGEPQHAALLANLSATLHAGWRAALPPTV